MTSSMILMCHEDPQTNFFRTLGSAEIVDVTALHIDPEVRTYLVLVSIIVALLYIYIILYFFFIIIIVLS